MHMEYLEIDIKYNNNQVAEDLDKYLRYMILNKINIKLKKYH